MKPTGARKSLSLILLLAAGCATGSRPSTRTASTLPSIAAWTPDNPRAHLRLEEIEPAATLPDPIASTRPAEPAPLEALALYGSARSALARHDAANAVGLLEHAIAIDPYSHDLYRALGDAYRQISPRPSDAEMNAFEKALDLQPDDLALQALAGEQYAAMGKDDKALLHLRQAMHTSGYPRDELTAAAVDLLLGRMLQVQGYDHAALDRYASLLNRLQHPDGSLLDDPQMGALAQDPRLISLAIGELLEKDHQWQKAYDTLQPLAQAQPADFDVQAQCARLLLLGGHAQDAMLTAADLAMRFDGNDDAVQLLVSLAGNGHAPAALEQVRRLSAKHPGSLSLALAQADLMLANGDSAGAASALALLVARTPDEDRAVRQLFDLYLSNKKLDNATLLLMTRLAANPDGIGEISPLFERLFRALPASRMSIQGMQQLAAPESARAARLFLIARLASFARRDGVERSSLEDAVAAPEVFAPAYRMLLNIDFARTDWTDAQKQQAAITLADRAADLGHASLSLELQALLHIYLRESALANPLFEQAIAQGHPSPQLLFNDASALIEQQNDKAAQAVLRQIVRQHPRYADAWNLLYQLDVTRHDPGQAWQVLHDWLSADPTSTQARLLQAADDSDENDALARVLKIYNQDPDDPEVVAYLVSLYRRVGKLDQFTARLEDQRAHNPTDHNVIEWLVDIYNEQGRNAQAARVLDEARVASWHDADLLYQLSPLYQLIGQSQTVNDVLEQVISIDPAHTGALNDLGFSWADAGLHLDRAQVMIQRAVDLEPDNEAFLDSLGWVLYKQKDFTHALDNLRRAMGPSGSADPAVMDHLGDALYRAGQLVEAREIWAAAIARLDRDNIQRDDLQRLRLQVIEKLEDQKNGRAVHVAPVNGDIVLPTRPAATHPAATQMDATKENEERAPATTRSATSQAIS